MAAFQEKLGKGAEVLYVRCLLEAADYLSRIRVLQKKTIYKKAEVKAVYLLKKRVLSPWSNTFAENLPT